MEDQTASLYDCEKWVALYWTLPVPWAGHTDLPVDADAAAEKSITVRYQRDLVRLEIQESKRKLISEVPYMEIDPFRPGKEIGDTLEAIIAQCLREDAGFVFVRFGGPFRARYHAELESRIRSDFARARIPCVAIYAEGGDDICEGAKEEFGTRTPKLLYTGLIDPFSHFQAWQTEYAARRNNRDARIIHLLDSILELRNQGGTFDHIAGQLNSKELYSTTGRPWTAESLRKFVKRNCSSQVDQQ